MSQIHEAYAAAAASAVTLLREPAVAEQWSTPSALPELSVGGLAAHLASQVTNVVAVIDGGAPSEAPIPLQEHYFRVPWLGASLDTEVNVGIREGGEAAAAAGPEALVSAVAKAADGIPALLAGQSEGRVVHLPWTGWSLTLEDFLVTRMMEIAVHSDDLAVSVDVETPQLPTEVYEPVVALLTSIAARRHGQVPLLRALSRSERAPTVISAL